MIYLRDKYHNTSGLVIGDRNIDVEAGKVKGLDAYLFLITLRHLSLNRHVRKGKKMTEEIKINRHSDYDASQIVLEGL